jgi:hypothetical protein
MNGVISGKTIAVIGGGLLVAVLRRRRPANDSWQRATAAHREATRSAPQ